MLAQSTRWGWAPRSARARQRGVEKSSWYRRYVSLAFAMAILSVCVAFAPISGFLLLAILTYFVMGSARGVGGVAMNTSLMEMVPKHLMGRVQNAFYFTGTFLQLVLAIVVGTVAQKVSLVIAFAILGSVYALSFIASSLPAEEQIREKMAAD